MALNPSQTSKIYTLCTGAGCAQHQAQCHPAHREEPRTNESSIVKQSLPTTSCNFGIISSVKLGPNRKSRANQTSTRSANLDDELRWIKVWESLAKIYARISQHPATGAEMQSRNRRKPHAAHVYRVRPIIPLSNLHTLSICALTTLCLTFTFHLQTIYVPVREMLLCSSCIQRLLAAQYFRSDHLLKNM